MFGRSEQRPTVSRFCGRCGSPRQSEDDAYCPTCGAPFDRHTVQQRTEVEPASPTSPAPTDTTARDRQGEIPQHLSASIQRPKSSLRTRWLTWYEDLCWLALIGGPLSFVLPVLDSQNPNLTADVYALEVITALVLGLIFGGLIAVVGWGLGKRRLWAWRANWLLLAYLCFTRPLGNALQKGAFDWGNYAVGLVLMGVVWFWPNYLYFRKRRVLFSPKLSRSMNAQASSRKVVEMQTGAAPVKPDSGGGLNKH